MPRPRPARLASLLCGLLLAGGVAVVGPSWPASAVESPSGLSATAGRAPVLSWTRVSGASSYDVEVSKAADFSGTALVKVTTVNDQYVPTVQLPTGQVWYRVRAKVGSTTSDWSTASLDLTTEAAPTPVRPVDGAHFSAPEAPTFSWQPVPGATSYTVQTSRDPLFVDPTLVAENTQKTTAAYLISYPTVGTYYWRVRAELGTGYATGWSTPTAYDIVGLPDARLTAPEDSFAPKVVDVVLDWEPVPGAASYQLQVSTDESFLTTVTSVAKLTSTRYSPPTTLNNDEYYWRVRPVDASGNAAPWPATPWHFRRAWPDQPTLVYPLGAADASRPLFFQWDAIERASKYTLFLYDANGAEVCSATTVYTTLPAPADCLPKASGTYQWKVRATDDPSGVVTDLIGAQTGVFTYTAPAPITPAAPNTLSVDQVTGEAASMSGTTAYGIGTPADRCESVLPATCVNLRQAPLLTWDPVPGAVGYRVTLSRDLEMTNVIGTYSVTQPMWLPTSTLPDSQAGSAYFWVVQPCSGTATSTCAPLTTYPDHSFAKKTVAPKLLAPLGGRVVSDDVTLDWGSELAAERDPASAVGSSLATPASTEAKTYTVQSSTDPAFGSSIDNATVDQTTYTLSTTTYPEGPVYWRVRANDGANNPTVWSETGSFEKRSPVPTGLAPDGGASLGTDYTLSWTPLAFAASYDVEVYAGATRLFAVSSKYASWTPSTPFAASSTAYTWRVRRVDAGNRKGEWSSWATFTIDGFPPSLVAPADADVVAPSGALFSWLPDARATSYQFERRNPGATSTSETVKTRATSWAPTSALLAGTGQWRVLALDTQGSVLGTSAWRDYVVIDPPATVTPVTIDGSGKVGTELRVTAPTFDPAAETTTYQWYRGSTKIAGETGELYTVVSADLDREITVRATGTLTGYKTATSTSNAITGAAGKALVAQYPPAITGKAKVGNTLGIQPGTWPGEPRLTYQWYRGGTPISGATRTTYQLSSADAGRPIKVVETATLTGLEPGTATSAPVKVAKVRSTTSVSLGTATTTSRTRLTASVTVSVSGIYAPGGSVTFYDGSRKLATVRLKTSVLTWKLPKLKVGKHTIKAKYTGGAQTLGSTGTAKVRVTKR